MKVSACVITKNAAEFFEQNIQTYRDLVDEFIVIDDHSTDGTPDIAAKYGATVVTSYYDGDKLGQRQEYVKRASGDWIFCPDADELWNPAELESVFKEISNAKDRYWTVRFDYLHFWRDPIHVITNGIWNSYLQRLYKRIDGVGHHHHHHTVTFPDGRILAKIAGIQGKQLYRRGVNTFHYAYCMPQAYIRNKLAYYMERDNKENCPDPAAVDEYVRKAPYFSDKFIYPRYGQGGLMVCGNMSDKDPEKVVRYDGDHPEAFKSHRLWKYRDYMLNANAYMEKHWQFNNHLNYPHHQMRLEAQSKLCEGKAVEVGCANGDSTAYLKKFNPACEWSGVEPTDWGVATARKLHTDIRFWQAWAENLPFDDGEFDTVLLSEMIEHVLDVKPVIEEAFRVAKKKVVITTPAKPHPDPDHKRVITPDDMRALMKGRGKVAISGITDWRKGDPRMAENEKDIHFMLVEVTKDAV